MFDKYLVRIQTRTVTGSGSVIQNLRIRIQEANQFLILADPDSGSTTLLPSVGVSTLP